MYEKSEVIKFSLIMGILTPYQVDFMEEVNNHPLLNGKIYLLGNFQGREWNINNFSYNFNFKFLNAKYISSEKYFTLKVLNNEIYKVDYIILGSLLSPANFLIFIKALILKKKIVIWSEANVSHHSLNNIFSTLKWNFKRNLNKFFFRKINIILYISNRAKNIFHEKYKVHNNKLYHFPYSRKIDYTYDRNLRLKIRKKYKQNKILVISVGQLIKRKGIDIFFEALKLIPEIHNKINVLIIGTGPDEKKLKELCHALELNFVNFQGFIEPHILHNYFKEADIFVCPSRYDGWGVVVNEAFANECCTLISNQMGAVDILNNYQNGLIFDIASLEDLAEKIKTVVEDENFRINLSLNARKSIELFSPNKMVEKLYDIFRIESNNTIT